MKKRKKLKKKTCALEDNKLINYETRAQEDHTPGLVDRHPLI
jgi:hypothetical protein